MQGRIAGEGRAASAWLGAVDPRTRQLLLALGSFAAVFALWMLGQLLVLDAIAAPTVRTSVTASTAALRPDSLLTIETHGINAAIHDARLYRADVVDGAIGAEQPVEVRIRSDSPSTASVVAPDDRSPLRPDGAYRLVVETSVLRPGFPLPRSGGEVQQLAFQTVAGPQMIASAQELHSTWAQPVAVSWSTALQKIEASSADGVPVRAWIDDRDRARAWVQVGGPNGEGLTGGQTYQVELVHVTAADGVERQTPAVVKVDVPVQPTFLDLPSAPVTLRYGETLSLKSSVPLSQARATLSDGGRADVTVEGTTLRVALPEFKQGQSFDVTIADARSVDGAPLARPATVHVQTPGPLVAPEITPEDDTRGVDLNVHPGVTFAEPVADRQAAERALSIEPALDGRWQWLAPNKVEFVPAQKLPYLTDFTLTVKGGPDGARSAAGGYVDEKEVSSIFKTTDNKRIDVNLSRQQMTLFEDGNPVRTLWVATGVAAAPTPPGTFYVQYKSPQMRFRGTNPDGSRYDIPDVHWVMPFWGDYTIHGAYWRGRFGTPGSDGCVSLTDADAKAVFDWANVGTPITIHY